VKAVKRLSSWDTYVEEATKGGDRSIEFPITADECYQITYPSRARGRQIAKAQGEGNTDRLVLALLGDEAGQRVLELAEERPAFVLDELLLDVMRKFGMIPEDEAADDADTDTDDTEGLDEPRPSASNGHVNGTSVAPGKPRAATKVVKPRTTTAGTRKSSTTRKRSTTTSRRSSGA
jgi:hypothetical protein